MITNPATVHVHLCLYIYHLCGHSHRNLGVSFPSLIKIIRFVLHIYIFFLFGPGFDSRRYQIFCIALGLERGPLSFVRINEELLETKVTATV
jgi:hypothetical protein